MCRKRIINKIASLVLMAILFISTSPYLLPILVSSHGAHTFDASFDGDALRVKLLHSGNDHTHSEGQNHDADHHSHGTSDQTKDHEVVGVIEHVKTSTEVQINSPAFFSAILPSTFSTSVSTSEFKPFDILKIEKIKRPPNILALQKTIVLHI